MPQEIDVVANPTSPSGGAPPANGYQELANSLGGVSDALGPAVDAWTRQSREAQSAAAQRDALANSGQAFHDAVITGRLERTQNPFYIQAYERTAAASRAHASISELVAQAPTWAEWTNPAAFSQRLDHEIGTIGQQFTGVDQLAGFNAAAQPLREQTLNSNTGANVQRITEQHNQDTSQLITTYAMNRLADTPAGVAAPPPPHPEASAAPDTHPEGPSTFRMPVPEGTTVLPSGRYGTPRAGHMHGGLDYHVPVGTPVGAAANGTATVLPGRGTAGNMVIVHHGDGSESRYEHLSSFSVHSGDSVTAGETIGLSGGARGAPGAGDSTGPHLHFEVRRGGHTVDPTIVFGQSVPGMRHGTATSSVSGDAVLPPPPGPQAAAPPAAPAASPLIQPADYYAGLEPMRTQWLNTGGTQADWNLRVGQATIAAAENTGRSDLLGVLNYDQGNGRGSIANMTLPNGQPFAGDIQQARYYIDQSVESAQRRAVRTHEAGLDARGDTGRTLLWTQFGTQIQNGTLAAPAALAYLATQNYTPEEATRALAMVGEEVTHRNSFVTSALNASGTTGQGALTQLGLYTTAQNEGWSSTLQTNVEARVAAGDMDVSDAQTILAAGHATLQRNAAAARTDLATHRQEQADIDREHARGVALAADVNRSDTLTIQSTLQSPGFRPSRNDIADLTRAVRGASAAVLQQDPTAYDTATIHARFAAAAWIARRLGRVAAGQAGGASLQQAPTGNPRR